MILCERRQVYAQPRTPGASPQCRVTPERHDTLRIGSDPIYVEPIVAESDGRGRVLILGRHNYRFSREASGSWVMRSGEPIFGVVVGLNCQVEIVPPPVQGKRLAGMSALPDSGGWSVVFSELMETDRPGHKDIAVALWYAAYDGKRWTNLERLPAPATPLEGTHTSNLARTPEGLVWIVPTGGNSPGLLVLKRQDGAWRSEQVSTIAAKAEPLVSRSGELLLAAIQPDTTLQSDGASLLLRSAQGRWGVTEVLRRSQENSVQRLESRNLGDVNVLTWLARSPRGLQTIQALITHQDRRQLLTVDSAPASMSPLVPVHLPNLGPIWTTERRSTAGPSEIVFHSAHPSEVIRRLGAIRNPFIGAFRPLTRNDKILLTGPITSGNEYVASVLIEVSARCDAARRQGHCRACR